MKNVGHKKQALKINDSNMGDYHYIINISGNNTVDGIDPNNSLARACLALTQMIEIQINLAKIAAALSSTSKVPQFGRTVSARLSTTMISPLVLIITV